MREKIFFLDYMDIGCDTTKSKLREKTDMGQLLKMGHQCGVFLHKEITSNSVYCNKIARTCCDFKSLPWQLLTFLMEEPVDRTKAAWSFLQKTRNIRAAIHFLRSYPGKHQNNQESKPICIQAGLILQESIHACGYSSIVLLLEGKLFAGLRSIAGICISLRVPTCRQDLPFYRNAYIRPGQK